MGFNVARRFADCCCPRRHKTKAMLSTRFIRSTLEKSGLDLQKRFLKRPPVNTSQLKEGRRTGALAMKVGMMSIWDSWGTCHATTVLQLDDCRVIQVKTDETDGYTALQLGVGEAKAKNVHVTMRNHLKKWGDIPTGKRKISEFRVTKDCLLKPGTVIQAMHFVPGQLVDVCGVSKGKGFAGVMKRWNFRGGDASHGNSLNHRTPGSTGQCQDPGRVFKGKKMPGRLGGERVTTQNLEVLRIDTERQLLYVKGAVPGNKGAFVRVVDAVKGPFYPSPPPYPTFQGEPTKAKEGELTHQVWAPAGEVDINKDIEPIADPI